MIMGMKMTAGMTIMVIIAMRPMMMMTIAIIAEMVITMATGIVIDPQFPFVLL